MNLLCRILYEGLEGFFSRTCLWKNFSIFLKLALDKSKEVCYYNQAVAE